MNQIILNTSISKTVNVKDPAKYDLAYSDSNLNPFGNWYDYPKLLPLSEFILQSFEINKSPPQPKHDIQF